MQSSLHKTVVVGLALAGMSSGIAQAKDVKPAAKPAVKTVAQSPGTQVRQEIQALLNRTAAAFNKKDPEAAARTLVPNATLTYTNGKTVTVNEWKSGFKASLPHLKAVKVAYQVHQVNMRGNSAVVTASEIFDAQKADKAQKLHRYHDVSHWQMTLVKTPKGWMGQRLTQLSQQVNKDGNLTVEPSARVNG